MFIKIFSFQWINYQHSKLITWYVWKKIIELINFYRTYMVGSKILLQHEIKMKQAKHPIRLQCQIHIKTTTQCKPKIWIFPKKFINSIVFDLLVMTSLKKNKFYLTHTYKLKIQSCMLNLICKWYGKYFPLKKPPHFHKFWR